MDTAGPRAYHGTAVLGYCIYVIGGFDGMDYFNSCRCFDAVTKCWREVTSYKTINFYCLAFIQHRLSKSYIISV